MNSTPLMLILPDTTGPTANNQYNINGLLDRESAIATATKLGYQPQVVEVPGDNYAGNPQIIRSLHYINSSNVVAIYGLGGGGYNAWHIWTEMKPAKQAKIEKIIVLGAPGIEDYCFMGLDASKVSAHNDVANVAQLDLPKWFLNNGT